MEVSVYQWFFSALSGILFCLSAAAAEYSVAVAGPERRLIVPPGKCVFPVSVFIGGEAPDIIIEAELAGLQNNKYKETAVRELKAGSFGPCAKLDFSFDAANPGLYELAVSVRESGAEGPPPARSSTYCLVTPAAEPVADIGVQTHLGKWRNMEHLLDIVKHAGITRIRDEMYWNIVEKEPGKFLYPERFDDMIRLAGERGIRPLIILDYGNSTAYPGLFPKHRSFPTTDETHRLFLAYVENTVKRYGHTVKDWELWNEPNNVKPAAEYLPLLRKVYAGIKQLDPAATVISCGGGGAGGGPGAAYISPIVKAGGTDAQDAFSIHPYMSPANPDRGYGPCKGSPVEYVCVPAVWKFLGGFCEKNLRSDGGKLKFWITEVGWPTGEGRNTVSETEQAAYLARLLLQHRRAGNAEALFIYDLLSDGVRRGEAEHNFGMLRADLSPKPSFAAVSAFLRIVGAREHTADISDEIVKAFRYGDVIALYSLEKSPQYVLELPEVKTVEVIQWDGFTAGPREVAAGKLTLRLSLLPTYVRILQ